MARSALFSLCLLAFAAAQAGEATARFTRKPTATRSGDLYLITGTAGQPIGMDTYKPDGTKVGTAVWRCSEGATGPRFDRQGNIYLVECIKERGKAFPDWFTGKLPPYDFRFRQRLPSSSPARSAGWMYDSVVKFPPRGGVDDTLLNDYAAGQIVGQVY